MTGRVVRLLGVYSDPGPDPRGPTVSAAYIVEVDDGTPTGGDDAADAAWHPLDALPQLAFDHARIVADAGAGGP
jgi:8-oxo-dGTP diphosphatase